MKKWPTMSPHIKGQRGEIYQLVVIKITGRDASGRPSTGVIGYDETVFHLEGGEEFMTAYVPQKVVRKKAN